MKKDFCTGGYTMQLSKDTKRFLLSLSAFTVALVLCVIHFREVGG